MRAVGTTFTMNLPYFTTSFNPSGNRYVEACGRGVLPRELSELSFEAVQSAIQWIVGSSNSIEFVTVSRDGAQQRLNFDGTSSNTTFDSSESFRRPLLAAGAPLAPIIPPKGLASTTGQSVPTPDGGFLFVSNDQRLSQVSSTGEDVTSNELESIAAPLMDGHITYSTTNQLWALFNRNTGSRYVHAILGDDEEGYELHVLNWNAERNLVEIETSVLLPGDDAVYEQLAPLWADINGDGIDDIVTTASTSAGGAQLRAYILGRNETSGKFQVTDTVSSPYIGTSNRWLHQIAVGPLGPNGETEVVEIRTPHIGGRVRYYRLRDENGKSDDGGSMAVGGGEDSSLDLVAETSVYSTHDIGSRNIDMATVADLNGDGIPELVVPDQQSNFLYGLQRLSGGKVEEVWRVPLGRMSRRFLSTNIAVSCSGVTSNVSGDGPADRMELLIGLESNEMLRVSFTPSALSSGGNNESVEWPVVHSGVSFSSRMELGCTPFLVWAWMLFSFLRITC